ILSYSFAPPRLGERNSFFFPPLARFIADALLRGRRCLRVIHGKGHGSPGRIPVLKHLSRGWLAQREDILAFCQARPHDGGDGALLVLLRAGTPVRG
ncbi:MAG TPA: Smr/MutS family protein, partial [Rhodocyclaceae bacterium]|nr:Smr/MutS family protein [Rhodocyclaceae bacterium]